jgi:L-lactate permease
MKTQNLSAMPIGVILMGIALMLIKYFPDNIIFDFLEGFLIGLSIVLNIFYMFTNSKTSQKES